MARKVDEAEISSSRPGLIDQGSESPAVELTTDECPFDGSFSGDESFAGRNRFGLHPGIDGLDHCDLVGRKRNFVFEFQQMCWTRNAIQLCRQGQTPTIPAP